MKRFLIAFLSVLAFLPQAGAQGFLDSFERALDKLTGNESETISFKNIKGRSYGANPGLAMTCREAGVKGNTGFLLITFAATGDTVKNVVMSSSDPTASLRLNNPQIADSTATFTVSPSYLPLGDKRSKKPLPEKNELFSIGTPTVNLTVPAGEMVDVMVTYYDFPKKVNKIERVDVQMKQMQPEGGDRYFGFTLDNIPLTRKK